MSLKYFPEQKKAAEVNCSDCLQNASISNNECINCISSKFKDCSKLVLIKDCFKKTYAKTGNIIQLINNPEKSEKEILIPKITPLFIKANLIETNDSFKIIDSYKTGNSKVLIKKKGSEIIYCLDPPENHLSINEIKKISRLINEVISRELSAKNFKSMIAQFLDEKKVGQKIKEIILRHTIGFGLLDILFKDELIQDIFIDSPGDKPIHIVHEKHNECLTNLSINKKQVSSIGTKVRAVSGRPFDESFPAIHYDLKGYGIRVCGICEPMTFKGTGYAFRKHRKVPWTIPKLIANGTISPIAAGLINFLVDGQSSILITGPRGSGKTSLLSAIITEIPINNRILLIEDTPELPVKPLEGEGFKIQHVRVKPYSEQNSLDYEVSAEEALRTSLRLGESVLIIGEVRGTEARTLFEAMRVGAAGNTVIGTIHGSSPYDTYDRIVNDLRVPKSSFKAADIIISCAGLRIGESLTKTRMVTGITEVRKEWNNNPLNEKGFFDLTVFNRKLMELSLKKDAENSNIIKKISELKGMTVKESIKSIKIRGEAKKMLSEQKVPNHPRFIAVSNEKLREFLIREPSSAVRKFRSWLNTAKKE